MSSGSPASLNTRCVHIRWGIGLHQKLAIFENGLSHYCGTPHLAHSAFSDIGRIVRHGGTPFFEFAHGMVAKSERAAGIQIGPGLTKDG